MPARITRYFVEQHRRVSHLAHIEINDAADLALPFGAVDLLNFTGCAQRFEPAAQVLFGVLLRLAYFHIPGAALRSSHIGDGLHCDFPFRICLSRCGVMGSCVMAPGKPIASSTAEAIAAPTPVIPLSPAPLMPSGLSGLV